MPDNVMHGQAALLTKCLGFEPVLCDRLTALLSGSDSELTMVRPLPTPLRVQSNRWQLQPASSTTYGARSLLFLQAGASPVSMHFAMFPTAY